MSESITDFWAWFEENHPSFPTSETFDETYGDELMNHLSRVHPDLVYETAIPEDGQRELVISGDGLKEMIPIVRSVIDGAPDLNDWKFTAFRPRMNDYTAFDLNYEGYRFEPSEIWFWHQIEDSHFDVVLYHADYTEEDRNLIVSASYIMLDMAIGEYDVMTGVRYIDHRLLPGDPESTTLLPFAEFRTVFDRYKALHRN